MSAAVLVLGFAITASLTLVTLHDYHRNEQRLLSLQTKLTASAIAAAGPLYVEDHLGSAASLAAATNGDSTAFMKAIRGSVSRKGPFAAASLWRVTRGRPRLVTTLGGRPLLNPGSARAAALIGQAAASTTFLVIQLTGPHALRIGYVVSATGPDGAFVALAEEPLPANRRISVPSSSPDSQLNLALYLGRSQTSGALLETNSTAPLPLHGTTSTSTIPLGDTVLTLTTSPRTTLSGAVPQILPWAIAAGGVLLTVLTMLVTERLIRGRDAAARLTGQVRQLYVEQRSVAESLQRALLPQAVPAIPGLELAARYRAAAAGTDIGGDWYDVVPLDEDRFVFVVGDVSGHDVRAAAVMASLHYAGRAYALEGHPPAAILACLRHVLDLARDRHLATVLCGLAEVKSRKVILASAGHLPPLVAVDSQADYPVVKPAAPIGIPQRTEPDSTIVTIPSGGLLIAYTDGLIERRDETLDIGMKRLAAAAAQATSPLEDLLDTMITELTGDAPVDDVVLIGLKWLT